MSKMTLAAATLAAVLLADAAAAATANYTSAWFFGDSLTDPGNLYGAIGVPPSPPYYQGRSSNGPVWAEYIADDFSAKGLATANYAYAYANAVTNVDVQFAPFQVPDLAQQIANFAASGTTGLLGERPVAALWFGANDILSAMLATPTPAAVGGAAFAAAQAVGGGVGALKALGIDDFVVFNLPALDLTPRFALDPNPLAAPLAKFGTDTFNATLEKVIAGLGGATNITKFDVHAVLLDAIDDPAKYGLTNVTTPCLIPPSTVLCTPAEAEQHLFFDPVHPNDVTHAAIAGLVRADIAPVPLPMPLVLLLAGVVGLAGMGLRRRA